MNIDAYLDRIRLHDNGVSSFSGEAVLSDMAAIEKKHLLRVASFVVVFAVTVVILGSINGRRYFYLSQFGTLTTAQITAKEPENHRIVRYAFRIDSTTFTGLQSAGSELERLNVGQSIQVYFYPPDPSVNCYCDPKERLVSEMFLILFGALVPSLVITALVDKWLRSQ